MQPTQLLASQRDRESVPACSADFHIGDSPRSPKQPTPIRRWAPRATWEKSSGVRRFWGAGVRRCERDAGNTILVNPTSHIVYPPSQGLRRTCPPIVHPPATSVASSPTTQRELFLNLKSSFTNLQFLRVRVKSGFLRLASCPFGE